MKEFASFWKHVRSIFCEFHRDESVGVLSACNEQRDATISFIEITIGSNLDTIGALATRQIALDGCQRCLLYRTVLVTRSTSEVTFHRVDCDR